MFKSNQAHPDGRKSARHEMFLRQLAGVLKTIRTKGLDDGRTAALNAGLGAHAEVRKALKFAEVRAH